MPRRRNVDTQPHFTFLDPQVATVEAVSLKLHSKVARRHAAYWGGSKKQLRAITDLTTSNDLVAIPMNLRSDHRTITMAELVYGYDNIDTNHSLHQEANIAEHESITIGHNSTKYLYSLVTTTQAVSSDTGAETLPPGLFVDDDIMTADLFSKTLAGQMSFSETVFLGQNFRPSVTDSCALISFAQSMALTGKGAKAELLMLKAQILRFVSCGILSLGSPIVCLLAQDLPQGLDIKGYINASMQGSDICGSRSATAANVALSERNVHWRHLQELWPRVKDRHCHTGSFSIVAYLFRYMHICMLFDSDANDLPTAFLIESPMIQTTCKISEPTSIFDPWTSPLTAEWLDESVDTGVETPTNALARLVHGWMTTFVDKDNTVTKVTKKVLRQRSWFRQHMEHIINKPRMVKDLETAVYASCRWAASVLLKADQFQTSLVVAAEQIRMQPRLCKCLRMTNLADLWGRQRGLLFWVTSVCHLATNKRCFPLLTTALNAHFAHEMALSERFDDIGMRPLDKLRKFQKCVSHERHPI